MRVLFYSMKDFERPYLEDANIKEHDLIMMNEPLNLETATLAKDCDAVCIFTADDASAPVLSILAQQGVKYLAVRAAGYDNVDLHAAAQLKIKVANVPAYSPYAIAEHAISLIMALNRKTVQAHKQVQQYNFSLHQLVGFDMHRKTAGIIGTGRTGAAIAAILHGFGCRILAYDVRRNKDLATRFGVQYTDLATLCRESDIITIHTGLNEESRHMINKDVISWMKRGVMLINVSRGAIVKTADVADALESGHIGYFGMDVYEHEKGIFFNDLRGRKMEDKLLSRLLRMPNVLVTPHQAFATREALQNIAETTFYNLHCWQKKLACRNELVVEVNGHSYAITAG
ncbi:2-hydroxyacid dehydrogenase [uncultured Chitinophaga sp.]|jgi:Lactate dehydrogenase and related dehydrogenases|uniref:2-hydroxyacid dehydrogenase n=1 Tax=uncultured Chitinophaga sp. TaxID=339340 RepID=UPI00261B6FEF|nr:2-hydroxyacid dehydrogenase [uncultured Chitinophaga sp.]